MTADTTRAAQGIQGLSELFARHGLTRAEPAILQPSGIFLDLTGEDIRRRLYLVQDPEGGELCLRPDYTIPVSRDHLAAGRGEPAGYCYFGPVFRYRPGAQGPGEFPQAGIELFGDDDCEAADARVMAFGLEAVAAFGLASPAIRYGDPGLFMSFVAALGLPEPWPRRLRAAFGREGGLRDALIAPAPAPDEDGRARFLATLARTDPAAARSAVTEMLSVAGISAVGGREPAEIADRLIEQAELSTNGGLEPAARETLEAAAAVRGTPAEALARFRDIAGQAGLDVSPAIDAFARRLDLFADAGLPVDRIDFAADFGRRLDYYTGFVFEVFDPARPGAQVVGGGRYDRLLSMLGAPAPVPAVGCSVWVDRLAGEAGR